MHAAPRDSDRVGYHAAQPTRISITVPHAVYEALASKSSEEGRSLSNLASHILTQTLNPPIPPAV